MNLTVCNIKFHLVKAVFTVLCVRTILNFVASVSFVVGKVAFKINVT
jgi:hypothetical protein